ncbi:P-loop containing nucleoside triphosphate hydrolase protein [Schizophyllum commune]
MPSAKQQPTVFPLKQELFPYHPYDVFVMECPSWAVANVWTFIKSLARNGSIGAAVEVKNDTVVALALASLDIALVIKKPGGYNNKSKCEILEKTKSILFPEWRTVYALNGDKLALWLHHSFGIRIGICIDLLSGGDLGDRFSQQSYINALGGSDAVKVAAVQRMMDSEGKGNTQDVALRAWAAAYRGQILALQGAMVDEYRINTMGFPSPHLDILWRNAYDQERLYFLKPMSVENEITSAKVAQKTGNLVVSSKRFKTRVMRMGAGQHIEVTRFVGNREVKVQGSTAAVNGRSATINLKGSGFPAGGTVEVKLTTVGRESGTAAERMRSEIIHYALRRRQAYGLFVDPLFCKIFLPSTTSRVVPRTTQQVTFDARPLNASQLEAVRRIIAPPDEGSICLVQGPPGTGKTTVIAAAVQNLVRTPGRTIWLVAQSNVAIKNVAEKLADIGFWDFRILVSKDFHYDWHEHLYEQIDRKLIRSDHFPETPQTAARAVLDARVMLCTLSCLSVDRLQSIAHVVPPQVILVDEASQIEVGDLVPALHRFRGLLKKVVCVGDDQQLPPYGSEDIKGLRSIFEVPHLRGTAAFLDTQYRMPVFLGNFISKRVYNNKLKSEHPIRTPTCIRFVNVARGQERSVGTSWTNDQEVAKVVSLAAEHIRDGKTFRVITPYDPQRGAIESALQHAKLRWEDTVFNVDSFQGVHRSLYPMRF